MEDKLKYLLTNIIAFDTHQLNAITEHFRPKIIKRNTFLLREGEVCKEFYFVHKGCLRTYFIDRQGNEKTRLVIADCAIGTALTSFITQKPSVELIEVLEDSEILAISQQDFYHLNNTMPQWKEFYLRILEMAYSFQNKRIESLVTLSAKQRYEQLLEETPLLAQKLSNKVLASYLDMSQETLSRLKSM